MKELIQALENNGFARDDATLESVYANTAQDAQYSVGAAESARILKKYDKYNKFTVKALKEANLRLADSELYLLQSHTQPSSN